MKLTWLICSGIQVVNKGFPETRGWAAVANAPFVGLSATGSGDEFVLFLGIVDFPGVILRI